jgi:hypothetical protein
MILKMIKMMKNLILTGVLLVGCSVVAFGQRNDGQEKPPPKPSPPKVTIPPKPTPTPTPKKPNGEETAVAIFKESVFG